MELTFPDFAFVVLIGPSGAGKSHFAAQYLPTEEVIGLSQVAALIGDDGTDPDFREKSIALLMQIAETRLQHRKSVFLDGDFITQASRAQLRRFSRLYHCRLQAIVFDTPAPLCAERNQARPGSPDKQAIHRQLEGWDSLVSILNAEGIKSITRITPDMGPIQLRRTKARSDLRAVSGPFDIIGDVHGCHEELLELIKDLGYQLSVHPGTKRTQISHPEGRRLVFVGDLCDRGPDTPSVLRFVIDAVADGIAYCVPGNHDDKLSRYLNGNKVQLKHGLEKSVAQLEGVAQDFRDEIKAFIDGLSSHLELDGGRLVVAHAGLKAGMHGRSSGEIHSFCLYGETTGETDEFGLPVRHNWAGEYSGKALVVYGHTPVPEPLWQGNTVNIDTGCVFGGALTALRYPELVTIRVDAKAQHSVPTRPMNWIEEKAKRRMVELSLNGTLLDQRMLLSTSDGYHISLEESQFNAAAAFHAQFCVEPQWLVYLPSRYSPVTSSSLGGRLEHPAQAFDYYRKKGVGSLAILPIPAGLPVVFVLCANPEVATRRFGLAQPGWGAIYSDSGRPILPATETQQLLSNMSATMANRGLWDLLRTDWIIMEARATHLGTGSKAFDQEVLSKPATLGSPTLLAAQARLKAAQQLGLDMSEQLRHVAMSHQRLLAFEQQRQSLSASKARMHPYHLVQVVATEGNNWLDRSKMEQLSTLQQLSSALGDQFVAPQMRSADCDSDQALRDTVAWWENCEAGDAAELLIGPLEWKRAIKEESPQAWLKVRTPGYIRLIQGQDYDEPQVLALLRNRSLKLKRETTLRTDSIGRETIDRFIQRRSPTEVFFGTFIQLGLASKLGDPRL